MVDQYMQAVVNYALSKVGCGYIMGATGWVCSLARRQQQADQYREYADKILGIGAKWDGKQCFDCAQLVRLAVEAGGGSLPSGATSQWNSKNWMEKGALFCLPDGPCVLYRESNGVMQHTGIYLGGGWVVEARGTAEGVIKTKLSSYAWTHWALPVLGNAKGGTAGMEIPYRATVKTKMGQGVGLWNDSGKTRMVASVPEGGIVDVIGVPDDKGLALATFGGIKGVIDTQYLVVVADAPGPAGEPAPDVLDTMARIKGYYDAMGAEIAVLGAKLGVKG